MYSGSYYLYDGKGDQIGLNFAYWEIVYCGQSIEN
jgi:hypothetical protein